MILRKQILLLRKEVLTGVLVLLAALGALPVYAAATPVYETVEMQSPQQNPVTVKGTITDVMGPIVGANVLQKGTTNGVITDINGEFTISVPAGAILVVSYIGYVEQEIPVNGRTSINVKLTEDSQALEEVVVVGYGTQKKVNLTGAVSTVNFAEQAESRPVTNVSSALAGLSAGVQVMQTSGQPGKDGATIRVRGVGTLNNADPLVLIDGIEGSMDAVNPQDVESMSVLKDAAASAIYGSRAANGVILINTKRGKAGLLTVNYSGRVSFTRPTNLIEGLTNYADYMEMFNEAVVNSGSPKRFNQTTIDAWREAAKNPNDTNANGVPNYVAFPNTDWQETLFGHNGVLVDQNVSVSGGSETIRFLTSAGYLDNPGLVENTGIKRYSLRANIEADIAKWLTVGTRTFASQEDGQPGTFDNANNYLRQATPGVYPRWNGQFGGPEAAEESPTANNILMMLNKDLGSKKKTLFNTTMFARINFMENLSYSFNFNYSRRWDEDQTRTNPKGDERIRFSDGTVLFPEVAPDKLSSYSYNHGRWQYTLQNLLNYNVTIAHDHDLGVLLGYEESYYYEYSRSSTKQGFPNSDIYQPDAGTENISIGGTATDRASRSYFGRINYAYKSRYLFEANLRRDGHSRYATENRWGTFPSFSVGWRASEESFMEPTRTWLDNLKIRASWGKLGNNGGNDVGNYEYQAVYSASNYPLNGVLQSGFYASNIANQVLSWEKSTQTDIGLDLAVLRNRLTLEFDWYNKKTTGILFQPAIDITAGNKTAPRMNIAEMTDRGIELTLGWKERIEDFSYSVSANFAYNHNQIDKYKGVFQAGWVVDENGNKTWSSNIGQVASSSSAVDPIVQGNMSKEFYLKNVYHGTGKGYAADGVNGGPKDGMIRTEQDLEWVKAMIAAGKTFMPNTTVGNKGLWYGDYVYADANGDGIYGSSDDRVFQGKSATPKYNFGLQLALAWKGFDLSMNWAGAAGFNLYWAPTSGYNSTGIRLGLAIPTEIANNHYFYDPTNPSDPRTNIYAKYGRLSEGESGYQNTEGGTTLNMYNANYLKLKNLTVGYTLPKNIARTLFTQNIRVYVSGENLLNFNSFPGQDPELGNNPTYTSVRQWAIGANITF
ncbi:MAG: TonB-dependent receptor [Mediterranea sp.]|jgi:TonB-linked SusC/RagA family outer membrane protein|nr:TonB-dependent receptor [Mediterranea sp.]